MKYEWIEMLQFYLQIYQGPYISLSEEIDVFQKNHHWLQRVRMLKHLSVMKYVTFYFAKTMTDFQTNFGP